MLSERLAGDAVQLPRGERVDGGALVDDALKEGLVRRRVRRGLREARQRRLRIMQCLFEAVHAQQRRCSQAQPKGAEKLRYPGADGGFIYGCGGEQAIRSWLHTPEVQRALHLRAAGSGFDYDRSGPASITLWPFLSQHLRVLIYNGDADACVPYKGNEEWIDGLEKAGTLTQQQAWQPWFTGDKKGGRAPAGYVTTYVGSDPSLDFSFVTIRLAGHMVPTFQPAAALAMFERFVDGKPF